MHAADSMAETEMAQENPALKHELPQQSNNGSSKLF